MNEKYFSLDMSIGRYLSSSSFRLFEWFLDEPLSVPIKLVTSVNPSTVRSHFFSGRRSRPRTFYSELYRMERSGPSCASGRQGSCPQLLGKFQTDVTGAFTMENPWRQSWNTQPYLHLNRPVRYTCTCWVGLDAVFRPE